MDNGHGLPGDGVVIVDGRRVRKVCMALDWACAPFAVIEVYLALKLTLDAIESELGPPGLVDSRSHSDN